MGLTLEPDQRIRSRRHFELIYKNGQFARGRYLNLWAYRSPEKPNGNLQKPKLGIIVSKKTSASAVKRNLWRRRIREMFRKEQNRICRGAEILLQSRRQEKAPDFDAMCRDFESLLKQTGFIRKDS